MKACGGIRVKGSRILVFVDQLHTPSTSSPRKEALGAHLTRKTEPPSRWIPVSPAGNRISLVQTIASYLLTDLSWPNFIY
jgi:hypothetical protein